MVLQPIKIEKRWWFCAFIVAMVVLIVAAVLVKESENTERSHWWRTFAQSLGWSFSSMGGGIITSMLLSLCLPSNLHTALKQIQDYPFAA